MFVRTFVDMCILRYVWNDGNDGDHDDDDDRPNKNEIQYTLMK